MLEIREMEIKGSDEALFSQQYSQQDHITQWQLKTWKSPNQGSNGSLGHRDDDLSGKRTVKCLGEGGRPQGLRKMAMAFPMWPLVVAGQLGAGRRDCGGERAMGSLLAVCSEWGLPSRVRIESQSFTQSWAQDIL